MLLRSLAPPTLLRGGAPRSGPGQPRGQRLLLLASTRQTNQNPSPSLCPAQGRLTSTPNHRDRILLVLFLDECLPCRQQLVEILDRDAALELTTERGLDPHGIGKAIFSADRVRRFRFLHGFHSLAIREGTPPA